MIKEIMREDDESIMMYSEPKDGNGPLRVFRVTKAGASIGHAYSGIEILDIKFGKDTYDVILEDEFDRDNITHILREIEEEGIEEGQSLLEDFKKNPARKEVLFCGVEAPVTLEIELLFEEGDLQYLFFVTKNLKGWWDDVLTDRMYDYAFQDFHCFDFALVGDLEPVIEIDSPEDVFWDGICSYCAGNAWEEGIGELFREVLCSVSVTAFHRKLKPYCYQVKFEYRTPELFANALKERGFECQFRGRTMKDVREAGTPIGRRKSNAV